MTTEEKAKKYDEALEDMRVIYPNLRGDAKLAVEHAFPELAESENERIREDLIGGLMWQRDNLDRLGKHDDSLILPGFCCTVGEHLAYLKKQKDLDKMIVVSPEVWDKAINDAYENGKKDNEKQKEQKPSLCDECKKKSTCLDTKYGDDRVVEQCINFVKMPQKPAEWSDTKELVFKDICNHLEVEGYSGWVLLLNALHNGEFQPKLAWSEEDEKIIDTIVSVLGQYIDYKAVSGTGSGYATPRYSKEIDWLNSLSLNLKKKNEDVAKLCSNEWSEEDEDTINLIIAILRENHPNGQFKTNPANTTCMSTISTDMLIKRIESLRPSWKPSEEQMHFLLAVINEPNNAGSESCHLVLKELYEQLKRL